MVEQVAKDEVMVREILSTAKALFAHNGLKKTTMEDIAFSLGKGKSTLYYYFEGKTEIFKAVVDEELKNLLRLTSQAINLATTAKDKLKAYCRTRARVMERFHNLNSVIYEDILNHIAVVLKLKQSHDEMQIDLIKEILKGGVQSGEFKKLAERDIELFSFTLVAAFRGIELPLFASRFVRSSEKGPDLLVDIMVDGIKG
ncbi:MAG: TetR/AcrR family transcriptional regulator [Bacteroidota bacterium]|nr:TetR/AcrR family transcriptional regulator [Bacteroidota bacterium]